MVDIVRKRKGCGRVGLHVQIGFSVACMRRMVFVILVVSTLGLTQAASWAASGTDLQALLDAARGRIDVHTASVNGAIVAGRTLDASVPIWPVYTFLSGGVYRLRQQPERARDAYQALVEWGAGDPYGDGWGGSSLTSLALWRWL